MTTLVGSIHVFCVVFMTRIMLKHSATQDRPGTAAPMLPENRLEHRCHFAAANHVTLRRMRQDAASTPVPVDPVYISHATMAIELRRSERCWMCLNS